MESTPQAQSDVFHSSMAKDIQAQHAAMLYATTASAVGSVAKNIKPERPVLHGFNGKFSAHLSKAGNWKHDGMNCYATRDRYLDNNKDWQDKLK